MFYSISIMAYPLLYYGPRSLWLVSEAIHAVHHIEKRTERKSLHARYKFVQKQKTGYFDGIFSAEK